MYTGFSRLLSRRVPLCLLALLLFGWFAAGPSALALAAPDFSLAVASSSVTVKPSGSGATTVSITPLNGFASAVNLSCDGLPANAECSFSAVTIPAGAGQSSAVLTVLTGIKQSAANASAAQGLGVLAPGVLACGIFTVGLLRRRRWFLPYRVLLVVCAGLLVLNGCGSSSDTPAGTSTVTVKANGGGILHTQTFQLVVQ